MKKKKEFMPPKFMGVNEAADQFKLLKRRGYYYCDQELAFDEKTLFRELEVIHKLEEMKNCELGLPALSHSTI
jgi:hypothetical protein